MAATVKELRDWLSQFKETELVGVDEGGLTLCVVDDDAKGLSIQPQFELGGLPEPDDDDQTL
jgi:hypothetical protein